MNNWEFFYKAIVNHIDRARNHPEMIESRGLDEETFSKYLVKDFGESRAYSVPQGVNTLLLKTKGTKDIDKLPFNTFFIDTSFDVSHLKEKQFRFLIDEVRGILVTDMEKGVFKTMEGEVIEQEGRNIRIYALCTDKVHDPSFAGYSFNTFNIPKDDWRSKFGYEIGVDTVCPKLRKYIINYVSNFLTLINNPEREVQIIESEYSLAKNKRRERKGMMAIPSMKVIVPFGDLKEYIKHYEESVRHVGYQFEVQGFWRNLRAERYGTEPRVIWIRPHCRGKGILIRKVREVESR